MIEVIALTRDKYTITITIEAYSNLGNNAISTRVKCMTFSTIIRVCIDVTATIDSLKTFK